MKRFYALMMIGLGLLLLQLPARASDALYGRIDGGCMQVTWSAGCGGSGTLTVYQNDWPIWVREVNCSGGSVSIALGEAQGRYSLRLNTQSGCLTANVEAPKRTPTEAPEPAATEVPMPAVTAVPAQKPTPVSTPAATPEATAEPTPVVTAKPTAAPTAAPTPAAKPTRAPESASSAPSGAVRSDLAGQVVRQVNEERARQGLGALRTDGELTRAATVRAAEIASRFSHTRPDGSSWATVSASAFGENIAMGQKTADKVMAAWLTSADHRANILRASYGSIGVCAYVSGGVTYWVQLFGR